LAGGGGGDENMCSVVIDLIDLSANEREIKTFGRPATDGAARGGNWTARGSSSYIVVMIPSVRCP